MTVRHSGFADPEQRYRQRYADLAVHPEVRALFRRAFADDLGDPPRTSTGSDYLEVETPVLQPLYGGATARPFVTHHNALDMPLYLRIADELYLKRLVVGGFERVYEIGHDFRNEGIDRTHNPEFTMLEFYEAYADYTVMMSRVEALLVRARRRRARTSGRRRHRGDGARASTVPRRRPGTFAPPFPRVEWVPSLNAALGADVDGDGRRDAAERGAARRRSEGGDAEPAQAAGRDVPGAGRIEASMTPTFVVDYPVELSPLAKPKRGNPALTERFELFAQRQGAGERVQRAQRSDRPAAPVRGAGAAAGGGRRRGVGVDEDYLRAMEYGMPPMGGVGIGIDRLVHVPHGHAEHSRRHPVSDAAARMIRSLELTIAWRYLRSRRGSTSAVVHQPDRDRRRDGRR